MTVSISSGYPETTKKPSFGHVGAWNSHRLLCLAALLTLTLSTNIGNAQVVSQTDHVLAVSGSWDLDQDPTRAHFVTGNDNVQNFFIKNYKLNLTRIHRTHEGFVKLRFTVKQDGTIDSISFLQHDDSMNDVEALRLLSLTNGAWRPGQTDGQKVDERIDLWFYFNDNPGERNIVKRVSNAFEAYDRKSWESCIKFCDQALAFNPFMTEVHRIRIESLQALGKSTEACAATELAQSYYMLVASTSCVDDRSLSQ